MSPKYKTFPFMVQFASVPILYIYTQKSFLSGLFGMSLLYPDSVVNFTPFVGSLAAPVKIEILASSPLVCF